MELGSKPIRKRSKKRQSIDLPFLILTILLLSIGLITLFSASYVDAINSTQSGDGAFYFKRQGMFALAGIVCMLAVAFCLDYRKLHYLAIFSMVVSVWSTMTPSAG